MCTRTNDTTLKIEQVLKTLNVNRIPSKEAHNAWKNKNVTKQYFDVYVAHKGCAFVLCEYRWPFIF